MIKHILKIIWVQRKSNGWIYAELVIVICALWFMIDKFYVDLRTYYSPLGYDITNTWRFNLNYLNPQSPGYVPKEKYTSDQTADLLQLMTQIHQNPLVEHVCATYFSCPYSSSAIASMIHPVEGDTTLSSQAFIFRYVTPEYFETFRVKDSKGNPITSKLFDGQEESILISKDMEIAFFHDQSAKGKKISDNEVEIPILDVTEAFRNSDYKKSEPCYFKVLSGASFKEIIEDYGASSAELCVRMKRNMSQEEMYKLLEEMGNRLTVNNLSVYSATQISQIRDTQLFDRKEESNKQMALMVFLLINVFFGIIGTFWLRTQYRQGESGIRMALGANHLTLKEYLYGEGLLLLLLTLPFTLIFAVNMIYFNIPDNYRMAYTIGRFLITFGGTYLLLAIMICLGILFPMRKISRIEPAEALHYE